MRGLGGREKGWPTAAASYRADTSAILCQKGWGLNLPDNICILNANIRKIYAFQTQILKYPAFHPQIRLIFNI